MSSLDCVFALNVASPFLMLIGLFGMGNATPHIARWSLSQAKVNAMRYEIDEEQANKAIKAISKDVPRTDKGTYFSADKPHRLVWLNDILVTYAIFNKEVSHRPRNHRRRN